MDIKYIDHFNITVRPHELPVLRDFYMQTFGLTEGPRPNVPFPGHWLYLGDKPVVHLASGMPGAQDYPDGRVETGKLNHISFRCRNLEATRKRLTDLGVEFREAPLADFPIHQVFVRDPVGVLIELTFDMPE